MKVIMSKITSNYYSGNYLKDLNNVLFLCYGNICRSPFAEYYFKKITEKRSLSHIEVNSAGFVEETGRRTPDRFVNLLKVYGVDLAHHRSQLVSYEMLKAADTVFVMDLYVLDLLKKNFPEFSFKAKLIGEFSGNSEIQIIDPWSLEDSKALESFEHLADSVRGILKY